MKLHDRKMTGVKLDALIRFAYCFARAFKHLQKTSPAYDKQSRQINH